MGRIDRQTGTQARREVTRHSHPNPAHRRQAASAAEVCELAQRARHDNRPLCLHLWCRDQGGMRFEHPLAVAARAERVASLRSELLLHAPDGLWSASEVA